MVLKRPFLISFIFITSNSVPIGIKVIGDFVLGLSINLAELSLTITFLILGELSEQLDNIIKVKGIILTYET